MYRRTHLSALAAALIATASAQTVCDTTLFATNNGLAGHGATMYFDVTATSAVTIASIEINTNVSGGTTIGAEIWTTPTSYVGNELDPTVWTMVAIDDGTGMGMGPDTPSPINLATPFVVPAGTMGIAIVGVNTGQNYTGTNAAPPVGQFVGPNLTIDVGSSSSSAFGGNFHTPRAFNGSLCGPDNNTGNAFCSPAPDNSTGLPAVIWGTLSVPGGSGLHLECANGPVGEFGYFLVGTGVADPGIPVSNGFLCLAVSSPNFFGRYNVIGGDTNSVGQFDLSGVLQNSVGTSSVGSGFDVPTNIPTPGGLTIATGSTWHFQLWYRDSLAGVGVSSLSNGLSVTF